jgi:hypothetical protein
MIIPVSAKAQPEYPFVLLNHYHIVMPYNRRSLYLMTLAGFTSGKFKKDAAVIDVNCRKFPVLDVINLGRSWNPFEWIGKSTIIRVKYVYGDPVQMSFNEARDEIVNLICGRRWHGQTGGSEKHFRETRAACKDMRDFLDGEYGISFYGKWVL